MGEKVTLTIDITPDEQRRIEALARQHGYHTPADYVRALIAEADDQAYFWSEEWQAAERKVDEEIEAGEYQDFATMEDFLADLTSDDE